MIVPPIVSFPQRGTPESPSKMKKPEKRVDRELRLSRWLFARELIYNGGLVPGGR